MSNVSRRTTATLMALLLAAFAGGAIAQNEEGAIKYRQAVMKGIAGHAGGIAQISKGNVPFKDQLNGHAHALHELAQYVPAAFKQKAMKGKTKAKDKIWKDWDDFEAKVQDLQAATEKLASAAKSGDMAGVGKHLEATFESCKGCHKEYRKKKDE